MPARGLAAPTTKQGTLDKVSSALRFRIMRKIILIMLLAVVAVGALFYSGRFGTTPAFKDPSGAIVPGSVATIERMNLGGVEQWVVIRGKSARAPILIWLHGGPGSDETGLLRYHNAVLEQHFLVVYWTQRGTGRSYHSDIPASSMTLAQFVADLDELIGILKSRFGQQKVVLAAHSWGTNIGVAYAQAHPQNVAAYVGIGQIADSAEGERRAYAFTLVEAKRRGDEEALADLQRIGPPPYPFSTILEQRVWLNKFGGAWHKPTSLIDLMRTSFKASEATWYDLALFNRGQDFSGNALAGEVAGFDWMHQATTFRMPVFIVTGRYDRNTDAELAQEYFAAINAPAKRFRWFEQSAHSPLFEEPQAFNTLMIGEVLPVALRQMRVQAQP
jgi:proline iminopeptidase